MAEVSIGHAPFAPEDDRAVDTIDSEEYQEVKLVTTIDGVVQQHNVGRAYPTRDLKLQELMESVLDELQQVRFLLENIHG